MVDFPLGPLLDPVAEYPPVLPHVAIELRLFVHSPFSFLHQLARIFLEGVEFPAGIKFSRDQVVGGHDHKL